MEALRRAMVFLLVTLSVTFLCEAAVPEDWKEVQYTYLTNIFTIKFPEAPREIVKENRLDLIFEETGVKYTLNCAPNSNNNRGFEFLKSRIPIILQSKPPYSMNVSTKEGEQVLEWIKAHNSTKILVTPKVVYFFHCSGGIEEAHNFFDSFHVCSGGIEDGVISGISTMIEE